MMSTSEIRGPRLETIKRQFERWRQTRRYARAPLPPRLWRVAVALVPAHGLYGTARALGLSYGSLKQHVDRARETRAGAAPDVCRAARATPS